MFRQKGFFITLCLALFPLLVSCSSPTQSLSTAEDENNKANLEERPTSATSQSPPLATAKSNQPASAPTTPTNTAPSAEPSEPTTPSYGTIQSGQVGDFKIGSKIDEVEVSPPMKLEKSTRTFSAEGEEYSVVQYTLKEGKEALCVIELDGDRIGQISIVSDKFTTEKGIGVGSKLEQFIAAYPKYSLWYTYVSDTIVLDTKELAGVQFLLNKEDFTGGQKKLNCNSDMCQLAVTDFKSETKIATIRMFQ